MPSVARLGRRVGRVEARPARLLRVTSLSSLDQNYFFGCSITVLLKSTRKTTLKAIVNC